LLEIASTETSQFGFAVLGLGTTAHCAPSQCVVRVLARMSTESVYVPTAHMSFTDITSTAASLLLAVPGLELVTGLHSEPSHRWITVCSD
jgi:hypothetical protein